MTKNITTYNKIVAITSGRDQADEVYDLFESVLKEELNDCVTASKYYRLNNSNQNLKIELSKAYKDISALQSYVKGLEKSFWIKLYNNYFNGKKRKDTAS